MLEIQDIHKEYRTGSLVQKALDGLSLNLRDNEFVAILGQSGSGKSTLLNIIGGLDRYDSGDLIINGVSTKKYKDRDWDSYRNHTIGFVFQSYNLIPHQTVLANVELALTISGISGSERRRKATEALEKVGLGDQIHKKPNQMSGGQMQRVAIARALVNDPDILLADEPTGALDTQTSIQVMDLLKEVARDRLVVMVTHNPELAYKYANRIVNLSDGKIVSDSNPYIPKTEDVEPVHRSFGKASMSFLTALQLSRNNLMTKKTRTLLVSFAGSIGIIGIALIMSLSNGVNKYIKDVEGETLSEYPLEIDSAALDVSSMMMPMQTDAENKSSEEVEVREQDVVGKMFSKLTSNDLKALRAYLESDKTEIDIYAKAVEYNYDISPKIYRIDGDTVRQVNPDTLMSQTGIAPTGSIYSSMFSMDSFHPMPADEELYTSQYEVKAGRWPKTYNEAVVVLGKNGTITDMTLYTLGLKDYNQLEKMVASLSGSSSETVEEEAGTYQYQDFIGIQFKLVNAGDCYSYDEENNLWTDRSNDATYMKNLVSESEDLTIVGVVQPGEDSDIAMLTTGIDYPYELCTHIMQEAAQSEVVQAQLKDPDLNIFTGNTFEADNSDEPFDMSRIFTVDTQVMENAFSFDMSRVNTDVSDFVDMKALSSAIPSMSEEDLKKMIACIPMDLTQENVRSVLTTVLQDWLSYNKDDLDDLSADMREAMQSYMNREETKQIITEVLRNGIKVNPDADVMGQMKDLITNLYGDYAAYIAAHPEEIGLTFEDYLQKEDVSAAMQEKMQAIIASSVSFDEDVMTSLSQKLSDDFTNWLEETKPISEDKITKLLTNYISSEQGQKTISEAAAKIVDPSAVEKVISEYMGKAAGQYSQVIMNQMRNAFAGMMAQIPEAFRFNADALQNAFKMNMDETEIAEMFTKMMSSTTSSYDNNLLELGYGNLDTPSSILIYPKDFEAKDHIKQILEDYNTRCKENGEDEKVISYTDMVGTLMSSVTKIVDTISYVLIAFVGISLVVSSIMIGVITYISVLERKKEIGILRAIGASKKNVSNVFNAETFITGLLAGVMGVVIAWALTFPINRVIHAVTGRTDLNAVLPLAGSVFLIVLSVILTLIGGLIPAGKAARSDPVTALRTD